jgi:hypothetical protein
MSVSNLMAARRGALAALCVSVAAFASPWRPLAPGVEVGEFNVPDGGQAVVTVVRVDPAQAGLSLHSAKLEGLDGWPTGPEWAERAHLLAAINAGMFEPDGRTTGFARQGDQPVNPRWVGRYRAVLVAEPREPGLPALQLLDRGCDDVDAIAPRYKVVLQGLRMVDCHQQNAWQVDQRKWSVAMLAVDGAGRLLLVHCRSPFTMHAFVDALLALPLDVRRAMYLEGGPEATLVYDEGTRREVRIGSYETGFNENDRVKVPWKLPNVLGVRRRATKP